jgi:dTDP-4-dehydrorhamnose 3,5-epimerase
VIAYRVSAKYDPKDEGGLRWNDPDVGIEWPVNNPAVSDRDQKHPFLREAIAILVGVPTEEYW